MSYGMDSQWSVKIINTPVKPSCTTIHISIFLLSTLVEYSLFTFSLKYRVCQYLENKHSFLACDLRLNPSRWPGRWQVAYPHVRPSPLCISTAHQLRIEVSNECNVWCSFCLCSGKYLYCFRLSCKEPVDISRRPTRW